MPGLISSAGSGPITWMRWNGTSTAWNVHHQRGQQQRKARQGEDDAAQTANVTKEKRNENQTDQRTRGRPGQGPALLYGGTGLCQEGRFQSGSISLADRGLARGAGRHGAAAGAERQPRSQSVSAGDLQQGQPAAMFFTDDVKGDYERIKARGAEFTMPPTDVTGSTIAMLKDTCGNLIQLTQLARW